ncbi:MAG: hemerythrin domain-containing protein, partial [Lachnospiraceae bacterium]|nr:hemerythrin domain-containing protein [Lachnospiraceae bacterium]
MSQIAWKDSYKIGVDFIDKEHQQLFTRMNRLLKLSENEDKSEWVCREGVKYLRNHTMEHFEHEEAYMRSIQYSEYEIHKRLHDDFRDKTLPALEAEMEDTGYSVESVRHFLGVCLGWVVAHTETEDQAIVGKLTSKWTDIPPEAEKEALESVIIQLVQKMFHRKANLISENYAGEDFGKVICCRFLYHGKKEEKWEVTLVYEERLLLKVIGRILNAEYRRVDDMVINVI